MNPFDAPPSTPAVSYESPQGPKRRRGRMVGAALLGAGLVGAGAVGVSALASADDPELGVAPTTTTDTTTTTTTDATTDTSDATNAVPPMFDLDEDALREFQECIGVHDMWLDAAPFGESNGELPPLDELLGGELDLDELLGGEFDLDEMLGRLDLENIEGATPLDGELVIVIGPDGPKLVDLGDGDGSVTVERDGDSGDVTITAEGSASAVDLEETFDELLGGLLPEGLQSCVDGLVDDGI